jgi:uncharacterized Zn-binding protein involved in type VI secretion
MPAIIRATLDYSDSLTHLFYPAVPSVGSLNVFINGKGVVTIGTDYLNVHSTALISHAMGQAIGGSTNVFVNGSGVHRQGDLIQCGAVAGVGVPTPNVFANNNITG